jgi:hypothetical protein
MEVEGIDDTIEAEGEGDLFSENLPMASDGLGGDAILAPLTDPTGGVDA